jgi:hypothetical protein
VRFWQGLCPAAERQENRTKDGSLARFTRVGPPIGRSAALRFDQPLTQALKESSHEEIYRTHADRTAYH